MAVIGETVMTFVSPSTVQSRSDHFNSPFLWRCITVASIWCSTGLCNCTLLSYYGGVYRVPGNTLASGPILRVEVTRCNRMIEYTASNTPAVPPHNRTSQCVGLNRITEHEASKIPHHCHSHPTEVTSV